MAKATKDFSLALSESIDAALEAEAVAFDRTRQSVAREVLQDWADRKHRAYSVYARRVIANGNQAELPGFETGDDGTRREGRR